MLDLSTRSGYGCKFVWDTRLSFKSCALRSKLVPFCVVAERSERARASPSGGTAISRACEFRHVIETDAPAYVQRGSGSLPSCTRRVCLAAALTGLSVVQQAHAEQARPLNPFTALVFNSGVVPAKSGLFVVRHSAEEPSATSQLWWLLQYNCCTPRWTFESNAFPGSERVAL